MQGWTEINVTPDIEQAPWSDLDANTTHGAVERVGLLRNGTSEGRASVALVIRLDDGTPVVAETTWRRSLTGRAGGGSDVDPARAQDRDLPERYTGRVITAAIGYVLHQPPGRRDASLGGYVVFSLLDIKLEHLPGWVKTGESTIVAGGGS